MTQLKQVFQHDSKPVSAGTVLTFNIPVFSTIDDVILEFSNSGSAATKANILAAIGKIAFSINGEQVINCPLSSLYDVYASLGNEVTQNLSNVIGLNVARYLFKDPVTEDFFSWGNIGVQTLQLQVYCKSSTTKVTDLSISTVRRDINTNLGSFLKIIDYPQNISGAGISSVDTLPRDSNEAYMSVMVYAGTGGVIGSGECIVNGINIFDPMSQAENDYIVSARGLAPVAGVFNYSFSDGSIKSFLPMPNVTELRFKTNFTTAPTAGTYDMVAISIKNTPAAMLNAFSAN